VFDAKIDVNEGDKKGNVEKWLLDVESKMRSTLKRICKDSTVDYGNSDRVEWVLKWPGQVILAVNQVDWTAGVETAI
jgi:dynein heavy chain